MNFFRRENLKYLILVLLVLILCFDAKSEPLLYPYNLDFEVGTPGRMPRGWILPEYATNNGYGAELTELNPKSGKYCLELHRKAPLKEDTIYGSVMQSVDGTPFQGKTIRFRAAVRAEIEGPQGSAHLWIMPYRPDGSVAYYDKMENQPIVINTWAYYDITLKIDEDSPFINFGLMLNGSGKAWIDDASFEIINVLDAKDNVPPKALTEQGLINIAAFSEVLGYIRYFYPGLESQNNDWEKFAFMGIEQVENAKNNKELKEILEKLYSPIAPALKFLSDVESQKMTDVMPKPENSLKDVALAWIHTGAPTGTESKMMNTKVTNIFQSQRKAEGAAVQVVEATNLAGKKIKFSAFVKAKPIIPSGRVFLRILPETGSKEETNINNVVNSEPIISNKWKEYKIEMDVPRASKNLKIGLILIGDGEAWFDDTRLSYIEEGKEIHFDLNNEGFEEGTVGKVTRGWRITTQSEKEGYSANIIDNDKKSGKQSLYISSDRKSDIKLPLPGELTYFKIADNILCSSPISVFVDSSTTLPKPNVTGKLISSKPSDFSATGNDRTSRLVITSILWNLYKHFNLYGDNEFSDKIEYWNKALIETLKKAATDKSEKDFLATLSGLSAYLKDGQARVWHGNDEYKYGLPFLWKMIDGKLYVTQTHQTNKELKPGDEILTINGVETEKCVNSFKKNISGATDNWKTIRALAQIRSGQENSSLNLKVKSGEKEFEITAYKSIFLGDLVEPRLAEATKIDNKIYYVDLTRTNDKYFKAIFDSLRTASGIIFDLRGTTAMSEHFLGFFMDKPINSLEWKIPVFTYPNKQNISYKYITTEIKSRPVLRNPKIVFLEDDRTIGFAEGLLSLIRDNKIGQIIGTKGACTSGEVSAFRLPGNFGCSWTGVPVNQYDGTDLYGKGVEPNIIVTPTIKGIIEARDEVLETALKYLEQ